MVKLLSAQDVISLRAAARAAGFPVFDRYNHDVQILGLRAPTVDDPSTDLTDAIAVLYNVNGAPCGGLLTPATTIPGSTTLTRTTRGAAVVEPGFYRKCWAPGLHPRNPKPGQSQRPGLVQVGPITVRRDADLDNLAGNSGHLETGVYGINLHSMGTREWSAGCIGPQYQADVDWLLARCAEQAAALDVIEVSFGLLHASAWNLTRFLP